MISNEHKKMKRYELWSELYLLSERLHQLADAWWDIDDDVQALHYDRCNYGQLTLYEPDVPPREGPGDRRSTFDNQRGNP